jgi:anti-sigma factor RsiW
MSCPTSVIETYVDGELSPERTLEVQSHLESCERCAEQVALERARRQSLKLAVYEDVVVSEAFRARLSEALRRADVEDVAMRTPRQRRGRRAHGLRDLGYYWSGPLAIAAGLAMWFSGQGFGGQDRSAHPKPEPANEPQAASAVLNTDELLDRLLDYHSDPPAPEVTEPMLVPRLERDVGVRVSVPELMGAQWQGAGVIRVRTLSAATLRYKLPGEHNVTIYVYNASRVPLHEALKRARSEREEPVYVGYRRGYSIAAMERRGLGYAVATDRDDRETVKLVTSLH